MMWPFIEKNLVKINIITLTFFLVIILLQNYFFKKDLSGQQQIATVDTYAIIANFVEMHKNLNLTEAEINGLVDKFSANLSRLINERAQTDNLVILPKQAIIAGAHDYTDTIKKDVQGAFR